MTFDLSEVRDHTRMYFDTVGARYFELFHRELEQKTQDLDLLGRFADMLGERAQVCDVGCGPCGHIASFLAGCGLDMVGIDLSPQCVALAKAAQPELSFRAMDMLEMTFNEESLDGLVAYYSILYTPKAHIPRLLREFHRVLKPGGKVLVTVKEGEGEGWIEDPIGTGQSTFFAHFASANFRMCSNRMGFEP